MKTEEITRPRMVVEKQDGSVYKFSRLWIGGKYVRDPNIRFGRNEWADIQESIDRINRKIMSK